MITKVTIRRRPISEGMDSVYIDYYPPLARKHLIPCYKNGNKYYFYEEELLEWIEKGQLKTVARVKEEVDNFMTHKVRNKPKQRFGFP